MSDFLGILVDGDLLATFVNLFVFVFSLEFVTGIAGILKGVLK